MDYETYIEKNYNLIRSEYEDMLMDQWYSPAIVSEVDDGWEERKEESYAIYLWK